MLTINIKQFKEIHLTECINQNIDAELDTYIKRTVFEIITKGKKSHNFNKIEQDEQIEYFLKYALLKIVPSSHWNNFTNKNNNIEDILYIALKRYYFLATGTFPV